MLMDDYCKRLLFDLEELSLNIVKHCCPLIQSILWKPWIEQINEEIINFCNDNKEIRPTPSFYSPKAECFLIFRDKEELIKFNESIENILSLTNKKDILHDKLGKVCSKNPSKVREIIFELSVCGGFAIDSKLKDIEVKVKPETGTTVDASIIIDDRSILVEATLISRRLGGREKVGVLSLDEMKKQIEKKLSVKTKRRKQFDLAKVPTILIIALPEFGADLTTSRLYIEDCFNSKEYKKLSSVIIADSYLFKNGYIIYNRHAHQELSEIEKKYLNKKYAD